MSDLRFSILDSSDNEVNALRAGVVQAGETKSLGTITIKNDGDDTPEELFLTALLANRTENGTNAQGLEAIDEGWIEAALDDGKDFEDSFATIDSSRWSNFGFSIAGGILSTTTTNQTHLKTIQPTTDNILYWASKTFKFKLKSLATGTSNDKIFIGTCPYSGYYSYIGAELRPYLEEFAYTVDPSGDNETYSGSEIPIRNEWVFVKVEFRRVDSTTIRINVKYSTDDENYILLVSSTTTDRGHRPIIINKSATEWVFEYINCEGWLPLSEGPTRQVLHLPLIASGAEEDVDLRVAIPENASTKGDLVASFELFAR